MDSSDLLTDHFGRIRELFVSVADGLSTEDAHRRPEGQGNPIVWLLWHTARVQDDHLAGLTEETQAWHDGWAARFDLPFDDRCHRLRPRPRRRWAPCASTTSSCSWTTRRPCTASPSPTSAASTPTSWTAWSTSSGTRRSPQECGWSA